MLCEVKNHLAQKEEKMKAMEGSHEVLLAQLQEEVLNAQNQQQELQRTREEKEALRSAVQSGEEELEVERRGGRGLQEQVELLAQEKVTLQWEREDQNRQKEEEERERR